MFKLASFEEEIYQSMEKQLVANQAEKNHGFSKLAKATDCLNAAAEIFEQAGMLEESKEITKVLHSIAMENLSVSDLSGLNQEDLHNILEMSSPNQLLKLFNKVSSITKGDSSVGEEIKKTIKEHDLSDPKVKKDLISKIMTALKFAKFF